MITKCIYKDVPFREIVSSNDSPVYLAKMKKDWFDPLNYNNDFVSYFTDWKSDDDFNTLYLGNRLKDTDDNYKARHRVNEWIRVCFARPLGGKSVEE